MKKVLGRKQSPNNPSWKDVLENIEEYVSKEELDELVSSTVAEIKERVQGLKTAFAWSGGKDSLVLAKVCEMAGVKASMLAVCNLEYPEFLSWIEEHKPEGLEIVNTGQDLEWLKKHPEMLFPDSSTKAGMWFKIVQHRGQDRYYKEHDLDMIILGRRKADGNYVGKGSNVYTNGKEITRYSPLSEWPHEAILAFIHYYDIPVPPIYEWPSGFLCGTHPWPARQHMKDHEQGWKEIYSIDKSIVEEAAQYIEEASKFLKTCK